MGHGLIIAAPASGSGKTTVTLGLLRALRRRGVAVRGAKSGPDYIDPRFHAAACGADCLNLDAWAMTPDRIASQASGDGLLVIEGAMGLFDGAPPDGKGATADLARQLGLPVLLVVDASHMAQSARALIRGFMGEDAGVKIAGIILNKLGSPRHEAMLRRALAPLGIPVLGALHRQSDLTHPSRHLGLIPAEERDDLEAFLDQAADFVTASVDLAAVEALAAPLPDAQTHEPIAPPAQRIAVASDHAFAFTYPHMLTDWRSAGAEISFFSPLADEAVPEADLIFLPGGYPELHAGRLGAASNFKNSLHDAVKNGVFVYGECGGYMVLGQGMVDADGHRHEMLGLLDLETSFAKRKLHLGYRFLASPVGPVSGIWAGHEFHYASTLRANGTPLFRAKDAEGNELPNMGLINGRVCGSFAHLIAPR